MNISYRFFISFCLLTSCWSLFSSASTEQKDAPLFEVYLVDEPNWPADQKDTPLFEVFDAEAVEPNLSPAERRQQYWKDIMTIAHQANLDALVKRQPSNLRHHLPEEESTPASTTPRSQD